MVGAGALIAAGALALGAQAAGPFDGTYTGEAAMTRGNNGSICKTYAASISVTDGHLTFVAGGGYAVINTDVAADGSFSGSGLLKGVKGAMETLNGKVSGRAIEAEVGNPYCGFHLSLRKAG